MVPQLRGVVRNDDQLGFSLSKGFQCRFVSKGVLATFHDKLQTRVDAFLRLFLNQTLNEQLYLD